MTHDRPRLIVIYGTGHGHTARVVRRMAAVLTSKNWEVAVEAGDQLPERFTLDDYDAALIAASVERGRHQRYLTDFVRHHRTLLSAMPTAFVSVSGAAGNPRPEHQAEAWAYVAAFLAATGLRPNAKTVVGGVIAYTKYGFVLRWITRIVAGRRGGPTDMTRDHEFTDWNAVDRFAEGLDRSLRPAPAMAAS